MKIGKKKKGGKKQYQNVVETWVLPTKVGRIQYRLFDNYFNKYHVYYVYTRFVVKEIEYTMILKPLLSFP